MNAQLGSFGNCAICVWTGPATEESVAEVEKFCLDLARDNDDGLVLLTIVEAGVPIPGAEQRVRLEEFYRKLSPYLAAVAQVVEGSNLWSVSIRSVMTAMRLVQRRSYPSRVFADMREGMGWAAERLRAPNGESGPAVLSGLRERLVTLRPGGSC